MRLSLCQQVIKHVSNVIQSLVFCQTKVLEPSHFVPLSFVKYI